jgi:AbrB family looped-hinge helix DNA binding protein
MQSEYTVHVDSKGYVLIPAEVRKAMGIEPKSLLILSQEAGEIRLVPSMVVPKRRIRKIPREELAQALIDGALTPDGIEDASEGIRELGLDPANFASKF